MSKISVKLQVLDPRLLSSFGGLPKPATSGSAASDVVACAIYQKHSNGKPDIASRMPIEDYIVLPSQETTYIGLGFAMLIGDPNYAAFLMSRSSASATNIILAHGKGLIDSDYTGEIIAPLFLRSPPTSGPFRQSAVKVLAGERIAQMYFSSIVHADFEIIESLSTSTERKGGFGSTGS